MAMELSHDALPFFQNASQLASLSLGEGSACLPLVDIGEDTPCPPGVQRSQGVSLLKPEAHSNKSPKDVQDNPCRDYVTGLDTYVEICKPDVPHASKRTDNFSLGFDIGSYDTNRGVEVVDAASDPYYNEDLHPRMRAWIAESIKASTGPTKPMIHGVAIDLLYLLECVISLKGSSRIDTSASWRLVDSEYSRLQGASRTEDTRQASEYLSLREVFFKTGLGEVEAIIIDHVSRGHVKRAIKALALKMIVVNARLRSIPWCGVPRMVGERLSGIASRQYNRFCYGE